MMKKYLNISICIAILLIIAIFLGMLINGIYLNATEWRSDDDRDSCLYSIDVRDLTGKEVTGTTTIMVPIPATKDGQFLAPPPQNEPNYMQRMAHNFSQTPESKRRGPSFQNTTQLLENKSIRGNWTTFIADTDYGYMLGFKTNDSILEDISFSKSIVVDRIDIFDPINNNSLVLYPIKNVSEISMLPYEDQMRYSSSPTYESYIYLSDNLENSSIYFDVSITCYNDHTKWPVEYRGYYDNYVRTHISEVGKTKVEIALEQNIRPRKP